MSGFHSGQEFRVVYPFIRDTYTEFDEDGGAERPTWRPGCRYEACGYYGDESEALADGIGTQVLTVVDVFKPGKYPTRIFYTVTWVDPEGRQFGKGKLHIAALEKFRRRTLGFMSHERGFEYKLAGAA